MANPAQLLLDQLNAWNEPSSSASKVRADGRSDVWIRQRIAVRHLDAISQLLDQMDAGGTTNRAVSSELR